MQKERRAEIQGKVKESFRAEDAGKKATYADGF
jgi:hypothetical protein